MKSQLTLALMPCLAIIIASCGNTNETQSPTLLANDIQPIQIVMPTTDERFNLITDGTSFDLFTYDDVTGEEKAPPTPASIENDNGVRVLNLKIDTNKTNVIMSRRLQLGLVIPATSNLQDKNPVNMMMQLPLTNSGYKIANALNNLKPDQRQFVNPQAMQMLMPNSEQLDAETLNVLMQAVNERMKLLPKDFRRRLNRARLFEQINYKEISKNGGDLALTQSSAGYFSDKKLLSTLQGLETNAAAKFLSEPAQQLAADPALEKKLPPSLLQKIIAHALSHEIYGSIAVKAPQNNETRRTNIPVIEVKSIIDANPTIRTPSKEKQDAFIKSIKQGITDTPQVTIDKPAIKTIVSDAATKAGLIVNVDIASPPQPLNSSTGSNTKATAPSNPHAKDVLITLPVQKDLKNTAPLQTSTDKARVITQIPKCGSINNNCYDNSMALAFKEALLIDGSAVELVPSSSACSGDSCFMLWKEKNGTRILKPNGLYLAKGDWQQKLAESGVENSPDYYSFIDGEIEGRRCPPHVFLNYQKMTSTDSCLYFSKGISLMFDNARASFMDQWKSIGGNSWDAPASGKGKESTFFEMNVQPCAKLGMRLPTAYETTMKKPPAQAKEYSYSEFRGYVQPTEEFFKGIVNHQLPDGDVVTTPKFARELGIPSAGARQTITASASINYNFYMVTKDRWLNYEFRKPISTSGANGIPNYRFWTWAGENGGTGDIANQIVDESSTEWFFANGIVQRAARQNSLYNSAKPYQIEINLRCVMPSSPLITVASSGKNQGGALDGSKRPQQVITAPTQDQKLSGAPANDQSGKVPVVNGATTVLPIPSSGAASPSKLTSYGAIQGVYAGALRGYICNDQETKTVKVYSGGPEISGLNAGEFAIEQGRAFRFNCDKGQFPYEVSIPIKSLSKFITAKFEHYRSVNYLDVYVYAQSSAGPFLLNRTGRILLDPKTYLPDYSLNLTRFANSKNYNRSYNVLAEGNREATVSIENSTIYLANSKQLDYVRNYKFEISSNNGQTWIPYLPGRNNTTELIRTDYNVELVVSNLRNNNNYQLRITPIDENGNLILPGIFESQIGPIFTPRFEHTTFSPFTSAGSQTVELGMAKSQFSGKQRLAIRNNCEITLLSPLETANWGHFCEVDEFKCVAPDKSASEITNFVASASLLTLEKSKGYYLVGMASSIGRFVIFPVNKLGVIGAASYLDKNTLRSIEREFKVDLDKDMLVGENPIPPNPAPAGQSKSCPAVDQKLICSPTAYQDDAGVCRPALQRVVNLTISDAYTGGQSLEIRPKDLFINLTVSGLIEEGRCKRLVRMTGLPLADPPAFFDEYSNQIKNGDQSYIRVWTTGRLDFRPFHVATGVWYGESCGFFPGSERRKFKIRATIFSRP